jgi:uncharacterized protein (DUF58 family)
MAEPAHPQSRWRHRWRAWWLARLPSTAQHVLTHRNLYLWPTRAGWMLGLTLLLLLVGSINYQLNLGYGLTFLLAGSIAASVHVGHANLRGLRLQVSIDGEAWAGRPIPARVWLEAPGRHARWAVSVQWMQPGAAVAGADVEAADRTAVDLPLVLPTRGRHAVPPLRVESLYPLGVVRFWSVWRPAGSVTVYPTPEPDGPGLPTAAPPTPAPAQPSAPPVRHTATGDATPQAVRPYRAGDAATRVLWKKAARTDGDPAGWLVRAAEPAPPCADLWLDETHCGLASVEARRARLAAWVLRADAEGRRYGLRLATVVIEPDHGPAHRRRCLEALACH